MLEVDADSEDKFKHVSALKAHVGKFGKVICTKCCSTYMAVWVLVKK